MGSEMCIRDSSRALYTFTPDLGKNRHGKSNAGETKLRHRCLANVNGRSLDVLRNADGNGVRYGVDVRCQCRRRRNELKCNHNVNATYQLILTNQTGHITPVALAEYNGVSTLADKHS